MDKKNKEITYEKILRDLQIAYNRRSKWLKESQEDFEFLLGKQWKDEDRQKLETAGVPCMTINKIQPNIFLVSGIQRQNRTDFVAYPEGDEDGIIANMVTKLAKCVMKKCSGEYKVSEQFEDAIICGEGHLEPYIDYTNDLVNGEFRLAKLDSDQVFVDPEHREYDYSDARYIVKLTRQLSKDQLTYLFPENEKDIKNLTGGIINFDILSSIADASEFHKIVEKDPDQYQEPASKSGVFSPETEPKYDLIEYYYKNYIEKWLILNAITGDIVELDDAKKAEAMLTGLRNMEEQAAVEAGKMGWDRENDTQIRMAKKYIPEIWVAAMVSNEILTNKRAWTYPKWKNYPIMPFRAHWTSTRIKDKELATQGIVRSLKDPQREMNKRRSQELRILNSQANSGWIYEEGAWVYEDRVKEFGASPGILLPYKKGKPQPQKIEPAAFPTAHSMSAEENKQDMKDISGINPDLLAMGEKSTSGRAIMLRMQQGTVILQRIFDNFSQSKRNLGKFILSQLGDLFTVDTAAQVLGDAWINQFFSEPVIDPTTKQPVLDPNTGEIQMQVNMELVAKTINKVLTDASVGKYDISIGEGSSTETVKAANYLMLMELSQAGIPIPPQVLVSESMLSESSKQKITEAIQQAQAAAQQPALQPGK